jgi:hypothetical protein
MQDVIKELSLTTGLDPRVITVITNHPFRFVRDCMIRKDSRPIRLRNLGVFSPKAVKDKKIINQRRIDRIMNGKYNDRVIEYFGTTDLELVMDVLIGLLRTGRHGYILKAYKYIVQNI